MLLLEKDKMNFLNDYFYSEKKKKLSNTTRPYVKRQLSPPLLKLTD